MDRYKIPENYKDCVKNIECKLGRNISSYLSSAILREVVENTSKESPNVFANEFIEKLNGKSFFFIKEVTRQMLTEAEMYCELKS